METDGQRRRAQEAQLDWSGKRLQRRIEFLRPLRSSLAEQAERLAGSVTLPQRNSPQETLVAEVLPLADACRFLERNAVRLLRPRRLSRRDRPLWLAGVNVHVHRQPFGVVLILGPANYPLMLPGIQAIQALVAGNAVLLKPGIGGAEPAKQLAQLIYDAGVSRDLMHVLPEDPQHAQHLMQSGVDKLILTGSASTGREVLRAISSQLTPATMELSGCDAVYVCPDADLAMVAEAIAFGLRFNGSATCIAPRQVYVPDELRSPLEQALLARMGSLPAVQVGETLVARLREFLLHAEQLGARRLTGEVVSSTAVLPLVLIAPSTTTPILREDLTVPLVVLQPVANLGQAVAMNRLCPYALGATVFGRPETARQLIAQLEVGCVVMNDMIVPTADPRVTFGGRKASGFGVTRGAEGLLEMTTPKVVIERRGRQRRHFQPLGAAEGDLFAAYLRLVHGMGVRMRGRAVWQLLRSAWKL